MDNDKPLSHADDGKITPLVDLDFSKLPKSQLSNKPVLHFVHANGIPVGAYAPLLDILAEIFSIETLDKLGTHPSYPADNHWASMTRQVADSIDDACRKHGVPTLVALGHSVGAVTSMQALLADAKPISHAILLDPSILTGKNSLAYQIAKIADSSIESAKQFSITDKLVNLMHQGSQKLPFNALHLTNEPYQFIDKLSPARLSKRRRDTYPSRDAAYESLRDKPLFRPFDKRCFRGYITHGFTDTADGQVTLSIPRAVEVAIFRTIPSLYWYKDIKPTKPLYIIAGRESHFSQMGSYQALAKSGLHVHYTDGSHMFPLERPDATAELILMAICAKLSMNAW